MPFRVQEVQPTPNPNAAKFVLDRTIAERPTSFFNANAAKDHALAAQLFAIDGVTSLLLLGDFITVNKRADVDWSVITNKVRKVLSNVD